MCICGNIIIIYRHGYNIIIWGEALLGFNQDDHKQSLIRGNVEESQYSGRGKEGSWDFAYTGFSLTDRRRKGDMLFACKASHPWWCCAFLKTFTLHLINRWTCSVVDFSEIPVPLRVVLVGTNAASDGRGSAGIQTEGEGTDLFIPFELNSTGDS